MKVVRGSFHDKRLLERSKMKKPVFFLMMLVVLCGLSAHAETLRLATTTSTENSGLLGAILPDFERKTGIKVHVIAVGTGKALRMGRDGDVDVVLVHARSAEEKFVAQRYGVERFPVMHNDFIIVGPKDDPAGVTTVSPNVVAALQRIAASKTRFISRGDDSGTHKKELSLWRAADIAPRGQWYLQAGQGMGKVLQMASEMQAYTLTDRGTWLAMRDKLDLKLLVEGDERLFNPYGIIAVNPARHPGVKYREAKALIEWFTSEETKRKIADFRVGGEQLFVPEGE